MSYHIKYTPKVYKIDNRSRGNGGIVGCAGHKPKLISNPQSLLYGNGCLYHNCPDCNLCPMVDCDYDFSREYELRKILNEKNSHKPNQ